MIKKMNLKQDVQEDVDLLDLQEIFKFLVIQLL